jgi:hypothetical protein
MAWFNLGSNNCLIQKKGGQYHDEAMMMYVVLQPLQIEALKEMQVELFHGICEILRSHEMITLSPQQK